MRASKAFSSGKGSVFVSFASLQQQHCGIAAINLQFLTVNIPNPSMIHDCCRCCRLLQCEFTLWYGLILSFSSCLGILSHGSEAGTESTLPAHLPSLCCSLAFTGQVFQLGQAPRPHRVDDFQCHHSTTVYQSATVCAPTPLIPRPEKLSFRWCLRLVCHSFTIVPSQDVVHIISQSVANNGRPGGRNKQICYPYILSLVASCCIQQQAAHGPWQKIEQM